MLRILYKREASNYLFDNGELTRNIAIAIESLVFTGGRPVMGDVTSVSDNLYMWVYLNHIVVIETEGDNLTVIVVMPVQ